VDTTRDIVAPLRNQALLTGYVWTSYRLNMTHLHVQRLRAALLGAALLLLLVAAAVGLALAARPTTAAVAPLDPNIPNEQALINAGLSGTPGPGQPAAPVVVDRVLVDGAATYVQFHLTGHGGQPDYPTFTLSDDQGDAVAGGSNGTVPSSDAALPFPLPAWVPWRPSTIWRGVDILGPLPATAHAAVLQFTIPGSLTSLTTYKTIRVPLDLRALARRRVANPNTTVRAASLTLTVQDLDFTHLTYTYALPGNSDAFAARPQFVNSSGRVVSMIEIRSECSGSVSGTNCTETWAFPPQQSGTRLTLTIPAFHVAVNHLGRGLQRLRLVRGPWRIPFVVP